MGGEDGDAGCVHVDEGHHHGGFGEGRGGEHGAGVAVGDDGGGAVFVAGECLVEGELELGGALFGVGYRGFVAVVAVGDDELLVGHGGEEEVDEVRVGELPDAMDDVVLVGDGEVGGVCIFSVGATGAEDELFGGEGGVGVEHVDLLAVGAGGLEEGEAVGLVLGEGLLVAVDDFVGVVVEMAEGDEAAAFAELRRCLGRCTSGSSRRRRARTLRRGCGRDATREGFGRRGCRRCVPFRRRGGSPAVRCRWARVCRG